VLYNWVTPQPTSSIFKFLNLHSVFHNGCTSLHSHRQRASILFSLYPH
jgi:hypothetical protein